MRFTWDEAKRDANLRKHGLDFADAPEVFAGPTCTVEDRRLAYGEQRLMTFGLLRGLAVSIIHTETDYEIRIISFRNATKKEADFLLENL